MTANTDVQLCAFGLTWKALDYIEVFQTAYYFQVIPDTPKLKEKERDGGSGWKRGEGGKEKGGGHRDGGTEN